MCCAFPFDLFLLRTHPVDDDDDDEGGFREYSSFSRTTNNANVQGSGERYPSLPVTSSTSRFSNVPSPSYAKFRYTEDLRSPVRKTGYAQFLNLNKNNNPHKILRHSHSVQTFSQGGTAQ